MSRLLAGRALVMVGMMGAGKSSVGRRLATRLGLPFVDADSEIEQAANATINEIFDRHGEAYFRDGERRVIRRLLDGAAEGAGDRRRRLHPTGDARRHPAERHLDLAQGRPRADPVAGQAALQPAAAQDGDPEAIIDRLIDERHPIYAEADIHVQSRDVAHDVVIDDILAALADFLGREVAERATAR